jgi:hypothetical protein
LIKTYEFVNMMLATLAAQVGEWQRLAPIDFEAGRIVRPRQQAATVLIAAVAKDGQAGRMAEST